MMLSIVVALALAQPFTSWGGTGSSGRGEAVRHATVALYGDSIAQGACSSGGPAAHLDDLLPAGYAVSNEGVGGETPHQIYARVVAATVDVGASTACLGASCGHYIVQGGVNTLKNALYAGSTPAQVASVALNGTGTCSVGVSDSCGTLDSVDYLHATYGGARIFAIGVLPYKGCDELTCGILVAPGARAEAYNSALTTACAARAWLTCVLPYDDFEDPAAPDYLAPEIVCADGIHLLDGGSLRLAQAIFVSTTW